MRCFCVFPSSLVLVTDPQRLRLFCETRRDLGGETVRTYHILWSGDEEASLCHFEGEEDFGFVSWGCMGFLVAPGLTLFWKFGGLCHCGVQPA